MGVNKAPLQVPVLSFLRGSGSQAAKRAFMKGYPLAVSCFWNLQDGHGPRAMSTPRLAQGRAGSVKHQNPRGWRDGLPHRDQALGHFGSPLGSLLEVNVNKPIG